MPNNQANRAAMRAAGHSIRCYASFIAPDPIATGTLTHAPPYPMGGVSPYINTTYVTGAYTDVEYGMEIAFFDTPSGAFKGRSHIRYGGTINALNLPLREYSQAMFNLAAGDTFRVYAEWRLHDKLVAALNDFPPDMRYYADADAGDEPEPVANSGGDWAGMVDGYGTSSELAYATVQMTGSTSFTVYPTGGTMTHTWTLPTGVTFAPGSSASDADPVLRATVGTHVITHEVEDDASGRVRASHPSIRVHNASSPPHRVLVTSYGGAPENGWNGEIEIVVGDVSFAAIPDGCKVILWGRERINSAWQSFRNASPGRSHILGVGYAARDTSSGSGTEGIHRLTFEFISPLERLKQIRSYSKVMLEDANPDSWSEITELGVLRGILQIKQVYLMWTEAGFDTAVDPDLLDERYPALFLDASNFLDQMLELAAAIDARMIVDRTGRLDIHTAPAYIPLPDRAAVTVALELAAADILDYEWTRAHFPSVALMKVSGISGGASGNTEVFATYPGAPNEGVDMPEIARLILDAADPQADINERAGRYGALADMVFFDEDGIKHQAFDLRLTLKGSYDCFDFYKEYIEVVIVGNARGLDLTGRRFYLLSSSTDLDPEYGTTTTQLVLRMETNAAPGETFIPTDDTDTPEGEPPPYEPPVTYPQPFPGLRDGLETVYALNTDGSIYLTTDFESVSPAWIVYDTPAWDGTVEDGVQSAFFSQRVVVVTTEKIYTYDYLTQTLTARFTFPVALNAVGQARVVEASFGGRYMVVWSQYRDEAGHEGVWWTYSADEGLTWAVEAQVTAAYTTAVGQGSPGGLALSSHAPGTGFATAINTTSSGEGALSSIIRIVNDTVAQVSSPPGFTSLALNGMVHIPFDNLSDMVVWFFQFVGPESTPNPYELHRRNADGTVSANIAPIKDTINMGVTEHRYLHTYPLDANRVACFGTDPGGTISGIFVASDGLSASPTWVDLAPLTSTTYRRVEFAGDDGNFLYLIGEGGSIGVCRDVFGSGTIEDKSGNLFDDFAPGAFKRIWGG